VVTFTLVFTPIGDALLQFLPWVGSEAQGSITYRQQLFDVSLQVLWQNPIMGDLSFLSNPLMEQLRTGQQIIDIVNTYLQIALPFGLLGLAVFLGCLLVPALAVLGSVRRARRVDPELADWGRSLLAATAGIMITIATVSKIGHIELIIWLFVGLSVGYLKALAHMSRSVVPLRGPNGRMLSGEPLDPAIAGQRRATTRP